MPAFGCNIRISIYLYIYICFIVSLLCMKCCSFCSECNFIWQFPLPSPYTYFRDLMSSYMSVSYFSLLLIFIHWMVFALAKQQDMLDPPEDCFRLRMVITLLETCGQFFDRGSSKRRLDRFLLYFQRYVLSKGVIPLDVEFDLQV